MNQNEENKLKTKFYALFHGKIDKEIIDDVLTASSYNGTYKRLRLVSLTIQLTDMIKNKMTRMKMTRSFMIYIL